MRFLPIMERAYKLEKALTKSVLFGILIIMRLWLPFLTVFFLGIVSCAKNTPEIVKTPEIEPPVQTEPQNPPEQQAAAQPVPVVQTSPEVVQVQSENEAPAVVPVFNPLEITREEFETTKADIQKLVEDLNKIIRASNYNTWLTYLTDQYRQKINSREFINDLVDKYPAFKGRINNARDYFNYVVVPSRANDRVDDIEFVSKNEVRAYTEDAKGQTVVLYRLENLDSKWKIAD